MQIQRRARSKGQLSQERIIRLEELGFNWDPYYEIWELNFKALENYKNAHGTCEVPVSYIDGGLKLGIWVRTQRRNLTIGKLTTERAERLSNIGFEWDPITAFWEELFKSLERYKREYGHARVPTCYKDNPLLGRWVANQRVTYLQGKLTDDRIERLESLGFEWQGLHEADWERNLEALKVFQTKIGHCRVPASEYSQLFTWCSRQRKFYSKGKLSSDRIARLEALGFEWKVK